jgi:hypothetical protein
MRKKCPQPRASQAHGLLLLRCYWGLECLLQHPPLLGLLFLLPLQDHRRHLHLQAGHFALQIKVGIECYR